VIEVPNWFLSLVSVAFVVLGPLIAGCCCLLHGKMNACFCQSSSTKNQKRGYEMVERKYDGDDEDEDDLDGIGMDDEEKKTLDMLEAYRDKLDAVINDDDGLNDLVDDEEEKDEDEEDDDDESD
jgi:hypothetical protein